MKYNYLTLLLFLTVGMAHAAVGDIIEATRGAGASSIQLGDNASAPSVNNSDIAIGYKALADGSTVTGSSGTQYNNTSSIAIGNEAKSKAPGSVSLGTIAESGAQGTSVGYAALSGENGTASGAGATATGLGSTANGVNASALGARSSAVGLNSKATGNNASAIGADSNASGENSVALGKNAVATESNSVSVGNDTLKRKITNVADGVNGNDVVNKNQLDSVGQSANSYADNVGKSASSYADDVGKSANTYTDSASKNANAYTDNASKNANTYADNVGKSANTYTDNAINNIRSDFQKNINNRFNEQDKKIDRGLASTAALSGLFQPYGVGKFNFTAGVGGYRSESALAIGSGYRLDENVAIKAGVSTSTSNTSAVMYNTSVNFEW